ncbi:MAG: hypothetical protein ACXADY_08010 [Candidatus Hodarchaeales archaeon]
MSNKVFSRESHKSSVGLEEITVKLQQGTKNNQSVALQVFIKTREFIELPMIKELAQNLHTTFNR